MYVQSVDFDTGKRQLTIAVDFVAGSRFAYTDVAGAHPVHDTQIKRLRHLNFFQHECYLEVRVPCVRLPDGSVRLAEPDWVGQLSGFTLPFEALADARSADARSCRGARRQPVVAPGSCHLLALCGTLAVASADLSEVTTVAIDETSYRRGHEYLTLVADMQARRVVFVTTARMPARLNASLPIWANTVASPNRSARSASTCRRLSSRESTNICPMRG